MDVCKEIRGIVCMDGGSVIGRVRSDAVLNGRLSSDGEISGAISADGYISGVVNYRQCNEVTVYDGEYIVTPKTYLQTLDTDNKLMTDDVDVKAIPYFETSNAKGITVYIGSEL